MRKYLLLFLMVLLSSAVCYGAGPAVDESQVILFLEADQETTASFSINTLAWVPRAGSAAFTGDEGFSLEDGAGTVIASSEGTLEFKGLVIPMGGVVATGLKAEDLDKGALYLYGQRR